MKKKVLMTSVVTIILCLCLIAGSTFALFTSTASVNVAVTSGTVDVQATITSLEIRSLEDKEWQATTDMKGQFSNKGTVEIVDGKLVIDKMTPGDAVRFTIRVQNSSNVATLFKVKGQSITKNIALNQDLTPALNVTTTINGTAHDFANGPLETKWVKDTELGFVNGMCEIKVVIEFPNGDPEHDNKFQNCVSNLQFVIEAVQANGVDKDGNLITTP